MCSPKDHDEDSLLSGGEIMIQVPNNNNYNQSLIYAHIKIRPTVQEQ